MRRDLTEREKEEIEMRMLRAMAEIQARVVERAKREARNAKLDAYRRARESVNR